MHRSILVVVVAARRDGQSQRSSSANSSAYLAVRCLLTFRHCVGLYVKSM